MNELSGSNIVYVGDINLNILEHIEIAGTFLSMLASKGMLCLVNEPTHILVNSKLHLLKGLNSKTFQNLKLKGKFNWNFLDEHFFNMFFFLDNAFFES